MEFDNLKGERVFDSAFRDTIDMIIDQNELNILIAIYDMMMLGDKRALKHLEEQFGITLELGIKGINKVEKLIKQRKTALEIAKLNAESDGSNDNDYIVSIVKMSNILPHPLDKDKITIAEYIYQIKECEQIIKMSKANGKNY